MSLTVFGLSQIFMDVEVIGRLLLQADRLHGLTNTILGATIALFPSVLLGKPLCEAGLRWWNRHLSTVQRRLLGVGETMTWSAAWCGGVLGVYSHWFFDAMMHADARAFWPMTDGNLLITWMSISANNWLCLVLLGVGCATLALQRLLRAR